MSPDRLLKQEQQLPRIEPVNPTVIRQIPDILRPYLTEPKWRGMRGLVYIPMGGRVQIISKGGTNVTEKFPELVEEFKAIGQKTSAILDGEIVAGSGRTSEEEHMVTHRAAPKLVIPNPNDIWSFVAFDLLYENNQNLTTNALLNRKIRLKNLISKFPGQPHVHFTPYAVTPADQKRLIEVVRNQGMEGVVLKRKKSPYRPIYIGYKKVSPWRKYKFKPEDQTKSAS